MYYLENNDGERAPAYVIGSTKLPSGGYIFFYTLDPLGRPTARIASSDSWIVQSEMGARLVFDGGSG
jgi:hypothetical protein